MTDSPRIPPLRARVARRLLALVLAPQVRDAILGDLDESMAADPAAGSATRRFLVELVRAPRTWFLPRVASTTTDRHAGIHHSSGDGFMLLLFSDIRFALRMMARRTGFTAVVVGTLALGIGASTAIFSAVHPILMRTLPYPAADQLVRLWERGRDGETNNLGFATFDDIERNTGSFEMLAAYSSWGTTMTTDAQPVQFNGQRVTPGYFSVLGVSPVLGRDFRADDNVRGTPGVMILSHSAWRDAFGADPGILGRPISLDGNDYTVIGVMPAGFENVTSPGAQVWAPLRYNLTLPWACRTCRHLRAIARLRTDVPLERAQQELDVLALNLQRDHPTEYANAGLLAPTLASDLTAEVRPALLAVLGAVLLVLLVASLNVSNLLLARGASRRGEFAVRVSLGADRGRIVRQLVTESLVLALTGGGLGVLIAFAGVRGLVALSPADLPRLSAIGVNGTVLLFALALTTIVGLIFGLAPAWRASRADLQLEMRRGARAVVGAGRFARSSVVVSEVALALVLLVGSGLLLRSMQRVLAVDPGFDANGLLTMQVQAGAGRLRNDTLVRAFQVGALDAVRQQSGVVSAALTSQLPLSDDFDGYGVHIRSRPSANPSDDPEAFRYAVTDGYFETMGIPFVRGRRFTALDDASHAPVAIISAAFAASHFDGLDPIGEHVRVGGAESGAWREIVGIVGDVRQVSLETARPNAVYLPSSQWDYADYTMTLVVRARGDALSLAPAVRSAIWSVDKDQPITRVATAERLIATTAAERRFALVLFEAFAVVALVLAAAGIYGVLMGTVTERARELGVRAAFGASAGDLVRLVLRQGMGMTAIGVGVGLLLALPATRAISGLLFGISQLDPVTYIAGIGTLLGVALIACWVPAAKAARADPAETLRAE